MPVALPASAGCPTAWLAGLSRVLGARDVASFSLFVLLLGIPKVLSGVGHSAVLSEHKAVSSRRHAVHGSLLRETRSIRSSLPRGTTRSPSPGPACQRSIHVFQLD